MLNRKRRNALAGGVLALSLVAAGCGDDDEPDTSATTAATETTEAEAPTTTSGGGATTSSGGATTTRPAGGSTTSSGGATTSGGSTGGAYTPPDSIPSVTLNGSGATFPETFYLEAIGGFSEEYGDVTINYDGTGSGTGREQFAQGVVDFAGTDAPADADDAIPQPFLHFPTVVAPVTVSYNLPDVEEINLTPTVIAEIFQGTITTWNDPAIAADNADVELPDTPITVVVRSDGSGTTQNFTRFLDESVGEGGDGTWTLGSGSTVEWPGSPQAAEGSGGVTQAIGSTDGAIGYVDLSDSSEAGLGQASVQNSSGEFVAPTLEATSTAVEGVEIADDLTFFAGNSSAPGAYPIAAQTWIIAYESYSDPNTAEAVKAFLYYLLTDGQEQAEAIDYAPLPPELAERAIAQLSRIS